MLVMLALGFAAGLPNLLIFDTLSAWLRLGHRRAWMLAAQAVIILGLWLVSGSNPAVNLGLVASFAVLVAFASATQDVVIDAWRIEVAGDERQGAMAAMYQWGYRIAILTAGVAPLLLAEHVDWNFAYAAMAALMAVGVVAVLAAPRERRRPVLPPLLPRELPAHMAAETIEWSARLALLLAGAYVFGVGFSGQFVMIEGPAALVGASPEWLAGLRALWDERPLGVFVQVGLASLGLAMIVGAALPVPGVRTRPSTYFVRSYGDPLRDFFGRFAGTAGLILAMICCYRLSDFVLNIMNPFYLDLGFDLATIAEVRKGIGVLMLMLGVGLGGWSITVLIAYMSSLTSAGFTATQYALFSSLYSLPGKLIAAQSGAIVEASARLAAPGGPLAALTGLFSGLPPVSFAEGAADLGVSAAALGAGYLVFFLYSCAVGVVALALALVIARRQARRPAPQDRTAPESTPAPS
ncbi:MAG: transporter [Geminicoccaceae bacterium]|nr:transporter [Geminicoccaceae bacterium]